MIGKTLNHFKVLSHLGKGGMGEVYLAEDGKLKRKVALKVLPEEVAGDPVRLDRFQREAESIAALNHPNIVTIYSIEEADGVHFLTMELVDGKTLIELIPSYGLDVETFVRFSASVAEALSAAHEKGIIHRDLKPGNIMVNQEGRVKVLDFGLAKLMLNDSDPNSSRMNTQTEAGIVLGTMPYMSPEQIQGKKLDQRSDIFSLGIIFYEMITGTRPFHGDTSADLISSIMRDTPNPVSDLKSGMPEHLERIIRRCLMKDPKDRYQTARDVSNELRDLNITSGLSSRPSSIATHESRTARVEDGFWIAVLPFKCSGTNAELAALADGLSEEIVTGLSRFSYLKVIARSATSRSAEQSVDVRSTGEKLGARYVIEGSLRQAGTRLRLTVQLVDADSGAHLWAENYERIFNPEAVFELQDELVGRIVSTVADMHGVLPRSMSEVVRLKAADQMSPYEALLRSFGYFQRVTAEELAAARSGLESALRKAPTYADAWAMLALLCAQEHGQGFNLQADSLASGATAARRAIELAPSNHLAYFSLAQVLFFQKEFQSFRNAAERAVALNPMDGNSIAFLGELLSYAGDWERGMTLADRAKQLNPNHPGWYWYADFYNAYRQGDYRGALGFALKADLPGHWGMHVAISASCGQLGERDAGGKAVQALLKLRPGFAATARKEFEKWWEPEYVHRMIDGLRKAGLEIANEDNAHS